MSTQCDKCEIFTIKFINLRETIEDLNVEKINKEKELQLLQIANQNLTTNNSLLINTLKEKDSEIKILKDELNQIKNNILIDSKELELYKKSNKEMASDIEIKDRYINTLKSESLSAEKGKLQLELNELKNSFESFKKHSECKNCPMLKDLLKSMKMALKELQLLSDTKEDIIKNLRNEISDIKSNRTKLNDKNTNIRLEAVSSDSHEKDQLTKQLLALKAICLLQADQLSETITKTCTVCKETASLIFKCFDNNLDWMARTTASKNLLADYKKVKITLLSHIQPFLIDGDNRPTYYTNEVIDETFAKTAKRITRSSQKGRSKQSYRERSPSFESSINSCATHEEEDKDSTVSIKETRDNNGIRECSSIVVTERDKGDKENVDNHGNALKDTSSRSKTSMSSDKITTAVLSDISGENSVSSQHCKNKKTRTIKKNQSQTKKKPMPIKTKKNVKKLVNEVGTDDDEIVLVLERTNKGMGKVKSIKEVKENTSEEKHMSTKDTATVEPREEFDIICTQEKEAVKEIVKKSLCPMIECEQGAIQAPSEETPCGYIEEEMIVGKGMQMHGMMGHDPTTLLSTCISEKSESATKSLELNTNTDVEELSATQNSPTTLEETMAPLDVVIIPSDSDSDDVSSLWPEVKNHNAITTSSDQILYTRNCPSTRTISKQQVMPRVVDSDCGPLDLSFSKSASQRSSSEMFFCIKKETDDEPSTVNLLESSQGPSNYNEIDTGKSNQSLSTNPPEILSHTIDQELKEMTPDSSTVDLDDIPRIESVEDGTEEKNKCKDMTRVLEKLLIKVKPKSSEIGTEKRPVNEKNTVNDGRKTKDQEKMDEIKKRTNAAKEINKQKTGEFNGCKGLTTVPVATQEIGNIPKFVANRITKATKRPLSVLDKIKRKVQESDRQMQIDLRPINGKTLVIMERSTKQELDHLKVCNTSKDYMSGNKRSRKDSDEACKPQVKRIKVAEPVEKKQTIGKEREPSKFINVSIANMLTRNLSVDELERFQLVSLFVSRTKMAQEIEVEEEDNICKSKIPCIRAPEVNQIKIPNATASSVNQKKIPSATVSRVNRMISSTPAPDVNQIKISSTPAPYVNQIKISSTLDVNQIKISSTPVPYVNQIKISNTPAPDVFKSKISSILVSNLSTPSQRLQVQIESEIKAIKEWDLDRLVDALLDLVRANSGPNALPRVYLVQASACVIVNVLILERERYKQYYENLLHLMQVADTATLVNLLSINITVLNWLQQTDVIVSFVVDLLSLPMVPVLLIARCLPSPVVNKIAIKYASFVALLKLLAVFEFSTSKHLDSRTLFSAMSIETQKFWLDGRSCDDFERCSDLALVVEAVRKTQEEYEGMETKANWSYLDRIVENKYR